jgi:hypothetical protein
MNLRGQSLSASWITYDYEMNMFHSLLSLSSPGNTELALLSQPIRFAVAESLVMHSRIITDILLSRDTSPDSIRLTDLLPGFKPAMLDELKQAYGSGRKKNSPCWTINKMLAHPTTERLSSFDYSPMINSLGPMMESVFTEVEAERMKLGSV